MTGPALLAICRLVALLDELHDCLEEAPSALDPAAATGLLKRLCAISRTHVRPATLRAVPKAWPARADLATSQLAEAAEAAEAVAGASAWRPMAPPPVRHLGLL